MIKLRVFVKDLPDGKILDADQVAPFHIVPGFSLTTQGVDPEQPYECVLLQEFAIDTGDSIPTSLPVVLAGDVRMKVIFEIPEVCRNFGFKAESDCYCIGSYRSMLIFASMLGYL